MTPVHIYSALKTGTLLGVAATFVVVAMDSSVKVALIVGTPVMLGVIATFVLGLLTLADAKGARKEAHEFAQESLGKLHKIGQGVDGLATARETKIHEQGAQLLEATSRADAAEAFTKGSDSERERGK